MPNTNIKLVYPKVEYEFEVKNLPDSITKVEWFVTSPGEIWKGGVSQNNSYSDASMANDTSISKSKIKIKFIESCGTGGLIVEAEIFSNGDKVASKGTSNLEIKSLDKPKVVGPSDIKDCCLNPVQYTATNICDADQFNWNFPSGWGFSGPLNQQTITLIPDNTSGGSVEVTTSISSYPGSIPYQKSDTKIVTRSAPTLAISQPDAWLCKGDNFTITFALPCGVEFPSGLDYAFPQNSEWSMEEPTIDANNVVSTVFTVGNEPGTIQVTANFDGCESISDITDQLNLITVPPTAVPEFNHHWDHHWFHCNKWQICPGRLGRLTLDYISDKTVRNVEYELTGNYVFNDNNQQSIIKVIVDNNNLSTFTFNGFIGFIDIIATTANPGNGSIRARFTNCKGQGTWSSWTTIYQEQDPEWCSTHYPYPDWCECCEPGEGGPQHKMENQDETRISSNEEFEFYPNPAQNVIHMHNPSIAAVEVQIMEIATQKMVAKTSISPGDSELSIQEFSSGVYQIRFIEKNGTAHEFKFTKL